MLCQWEMITPQHQRKSKTLSVKDILIWHIVQWQWMSGMAAPSIHCLKRWCQPQDSFSFQMNQKNILATSQTKKMLMWGGPQVCTTVEQSQIHLPKPDGFLLQHLTKTQVAQTGFWVSSWPQHVSQAQCLAWIDPSCKSHWWPKLNNQTCSLQKHLSHRQKVQHACQTIQTQTCLQGTLWCSYVERKL